ncbi:MAG: hypothetical protein ACRCSV_02490 [Chlamydiales bacterium]
MDYIIRYSNWIILGIFLYGNIVIGVVTFNGSNYSNSVVEESYNELFFIQQVDQNNIAKLIIQLGNWGIGRLLWHVKEMNRLGDRIRHVHPLSFLAYIYSQPELAKSMKLINSSYFKRKEFITGLSEKMEIEAERDNLLPYVKNFSEKIGCDRWEDISIFIDRHDWIGLLDYLDDL